MAVITIGKDGNIVIKTDDKATIKMEGAPVIPVKEICMHPIETCYVNKENNSCKCNQCGAMFTITPFDLTKVLEAIRYLHDTLGTAMFYNNADEDLQNSLRCSANALRELTDSVIDIQRLIPDNAKISCKHAIDLSSILPKVMQTSYPGYNPYDYDRDSKAGDIEEDTQTEAPVEEPTNLPTKKTRKAAPKKPKATKSDN